MSYDQIVAIEPKVAEIVRMAREIGRPTWEDYSRLKGHLSWLVGWGAKDKRLASTQAYDAALSVMVEALGI